MKTINVVVLVKQVPNTTEIKLDRKTGNLIREGVDSIINPDDRQALEIALQIKDKHQAKITVISMGPPQSIDAISEAMGMGCDAGILLTDKAFAGADTWATSTTLGKALEKIDDYDLILCGRQAIDGDTAQTGPQIAEYLNIPQASYVDKIEELKNGTITATRRLEDGYERLTISLPALLTITRIQTTPRYPEIGNLIAACHKRAPMEVWNAADIRAQTNEIGMEGSLTQVIKTFSPKSKREGELLTGDVPEAVTSLIGKLKQHHLL